MSREFLVNLLREAKFELDGLVASLTANDRNTAGSSEHWSTKDTIAHLGIWQSRLIDEFNQVEKDGSLPDWGDIDKANLLIFQQNADKPWSEIWDQLDSAYRAVIDRMDHSDEGIFSTPIGRGSTFGRVILGNNFIHWLEHMINWYLEHNDQQNAERLLDLEMRGLLGYDPSPAAQWVAKYNQACFFTKTCKYDKAVGLLKDAFELQPSLVEWSREDNDLVNLHGYAAYEALYTKE